MRGHPDRKIDAGHWLVRCRRLPTSNCEPRPHPSGIELVVIHGVSLPPGQFGGGFVERLFTNTLDVSTHAAFASLSGVRVSAHAFIDRKGHVTQFVPFDMAAWHAGVSSWRGRPGCNRYSVGIELEGTDTRPYTAAQYRILAGVLNALIAKYRGLGRDTIVGHAEIAPGRKTDPGPAFDWMKLFRMLHQ